MVRAVIEVVGLHGFAGSGESWEPVARHLPDGVRLVAPNLPGHGPWDGEPVSFGTCGKAVLDWAAPSFVLAGYSMGGRIALTVALVAPERVERLVLISTTAGIEDRDERAARRAADEALAHETELGSIEAFAARWTTQPLFAGDPPEVVERSEQEIRRNSPDGLAASLRGVGTGAMAPLWDRLGELQMPVTVVVGERDEKYRAIGERLVSALPAAEPLVVVPGAGHGAASGGSGGCGGGDRGGAAQSR